MATAFMPMQADRVKTRLPEDYRDYRGAEPGPLGMFLGFFSLGLGLTELCCPNSLAKLIGFRLSPEIIRAYGLREIATGVGILSDDRPATWLWGRVAGDTLDLATLAAAYNEAGPADRQRLIGAAAAVAGVTVLDVISATDHSL
jgi:uncharacterized protein YjeT (DUF2065 family)